MDKGARINEADYKGRTPLWAAASFGHIQVVRELVERNASINLRGGGDKSPLYIAILNGHDRVADFLIRKSADKQEPLFWAAKNGDIAVVKELHELGADVNQMHKGNTPLFAAAGKGHLDIVE